MFIGFKFLNDFNCIYSCIYSVVFIYWLTINQLLPLSFISPEPVTYLQGQSASNTNASMYIQMQIYSLIPLLSHINTAFYTLGINTGDHLKNIFQQPEKKSPCVKSRISLTKKKPLGRPWWPVVKALHFQCRGRQFNPWSGSEDPTCRLIQPERKKTSRDKNYVRRWSLQYYL